jgi:hypothetical protein
MRLYIECGSFLLRAGYKSGMKQCAALFWFFWDEQVTRADQATGRHPAEFRQESSTTLQALPCEAAAQPQPRGHMGGAVWRNLPGAGLGARPGTCNTISGTGVSPAPLDRTTRAFQHATKQCPHTTEKPGRRRWALHTGQNTGPGRSPAIPLPAPVCHQHP